MMTDEDFIKLFGCDRDTYDRILCENEYSILRERDAQYEESLAMEEEDVNILNNVEASKDDYESLGICGRRKDSEAKIDSQKQK